MAVELRPVTVENFYAVASLKVRDDQLSYVASNVFSIAQSKFYPGWQPMAVYADDTPVGFIMWGVDTDQPTEQWWIIRLMVDAQHQGKGYGKAATLAAIEVLRAGGAKAVFLSFEPQNTAGEQFYRRLGFQDTGRVEHGEIVYSLPLEQV